MAEEMDSKLQELNDGTVRVLIPAIVVVVILMIVGLIGNPLVIYFFGFRVKPTASYMFIVTLACFDFIICSVSMPLEIVDLVKFYTFEDSNACRLLRFVNYFASIASGAILIAIAVDRFRRICKPFNKQISNKLAKIIIISVMAFSLLFSWPSLAIYRVVHVNITTSLDTVIGFDCTTIREPEYKLYITIYNIILFLLFMGSIVVLIVLYSLVGKQLFKLKSFRFYATRRTTKQRRSKSSEAVTVSGTQITDNQSKSEKDKDDFSSIPNLMTSGDNVTFSSKGGLKLSSESVGPDENQMSEGSFRKIELQALSNSSDATVAPKPMDNYDKTTDVTQNGASDEPDLKGTKCTNIEDSRKPGKLENNKKMQAQNIDTKKYTVITILISAAFIISFLPYLCLMTWRTLSPDYEPNMLSDSALVAFQIFLRSFLLSSVCNPLIYGFLNTDFKNMIKRNIKCLCCSAADNLEKTSSPDQSAMSKST